MNLKKAACNALNSKKYDVISNVVKAFDTKEALNKNRDDFNKAFKVMLGNYYGHSYVSSWHEGVLVKANGSETIIRRNKNLISVITLNDGEEVGCKSVSDWCSLRSAVCSAVNIA